VTHAPCRHPRRGVSVLAVAGLASAGCIDGPAASPHELPEDRGTQLATGGDVGFFSEFAWSADGLRIFFQPDGARPTLRSVALSGGGVQTLDGPRDEYVDLAPSADGAFVYFAADVVEGRRTAYRLPLGGGGPVALASVSRARQIRGQADGATLVADRTGARAAIVAAPDTLVLTDATGRRTAVGRGCERVLMFSPDGRSVLCRVGDAANGLVIDLATGATSEVVLLPPGEGVLIRVHWGAAGIQSLYIGSLGYHIYDAGTRQTRNIWRHPGRSSMLVDQEHAAWSADGSRLALWTHECMESTTLGTCRRGQSIVHLVDPAGPTETRLAVAKGRAGGQYIAFSPDGRQVAYVFDSRIHTRAVP
jgi:hypothetical protein